MPETKPEAQPGAPQESIGDTFKGYSRVLRDTLFVLFISATMLMTFVYMNMNTTLGVYLRDVHGVIESRYGLILSMNAAMVVVFQFPITRYIEKLPPMLMMALGSALYAVGFAMYGFVSAYILFLLAMAIITVGEMLVAPVGQALIARFAPEDMRGRYMAISGFAYGIAYAVGPLFAGLILDNADPRFLWWAAGFIGIMAVTMFVWLHGKLQAKPEAVEVIAER